MEQHKHYYVRNGEWKTLNVAIHSRNEWILPMNSGGDDMGS